MVSSRIRHRIDEGPQHGQLRVDNRAELFGCGGDVAPLVVVRRMQREQHAAHRQHVVGDLGIVQGSAAPGIVDRKPLPRARENAAKLPPPRRRLGAVAHKREVEQDQRAADRLKLRLLSGELAVGGPDQEAENDRQQRRVQAADRADHALGRRDIGLRQLRLHANPTSALAKVANAMIAARTMKIIAPIDPGAGEVRRRIQAASTRGRKQRTPQGCRQKLATL